jgi:hypothetical protein
MYFNEFFLDFQACESYIPLRTFANHGPHKIGEAFFRPEYADMSNQGSPLIPIPN